MDAGHEIGAVAPGHKRHPGVGIFRHVGIVGRENHNLGATVFRFGKEMRVRGAGHIYVRAGDNPVGAEIPVRAFAIFRLISEHRGRNMWKVVVPLIVAAINTAKQIIVPVTRYKA